MVVTVAVPHMDLSTMSVPLRSVETFAIVVHHANTSIVTSVPNPLLVSIVDIASPHVD